MWDEDKIDLSYGDGGKLTHQLIKEEILSRLDSPALLSLGDAAILESFSGRLAFTTDSYVVNPIFFPGGDIGKLAVSGTVNDLAVSFATPLYLTLGLIIEAGLSFGELRGILDSIAKTAKEAGVKVVAGDTKVVEKGKGDKVYINTAGIGVVSEGRHPSSIQPGDKVIINGEIGSHGVAVLSSRQGLDFSTTVRSDCAPLNDLLDCIRDLPIRIMRDPTRGGLATTLVELSHMSNIEIIINEEDIPILPATQGACDMLGLDPLYLANEGKVVMVVPKDMAEEVLIRLRSHPLGTRAAVIGEVTRKASYPSSEYDGHVFLKTVIGGLRPLGMLTGEPLPRIC